MVDLEENKKTVQSFRARMDRTRTSSEKVADFLTTKLGSIPFLLLNILFFIIWVLWNTSSLPGVEPFDPYPFGLLTTIVSLQAIILAIIVLISQSRAAKVNDLREEAEYYINSYAENEITKLLYLQTLLLKKNGIDVSEDPDLQRMLQSVDHGEIERELQKEIS